MLRDSVGGLSAGVVGTVIGYPLDTIKTRMQTGAAGGAANHSLFAIGRRIAVEEGVRGFYKGVATPLVSLTILNTLNFTSYNYFKRAFEGDGGTVGGLVKCFASGALAGPIASAVSTPEHMMKTQMQIDNTRKGGAIFKNGAFDAAAQIVRARGFGALYVGHASNTLREGVFLGVYFSSYEAARRALPESKASIPIAGGLAGALGWVISYPLDCIKANIQGAAFTDGAAATARSSPSILTAGKHILAQRGISGLYSGLKPSLIRAFLVSGSRFSAFEGGLWICEQYGI